MRNISKAVALLVCLGILAMGTYALAGDVTVKVNGTPVVFDVQPTITDGRTMVPLRKIFEAMGAQVTWDQDTKTIYGAKGDKIIVLQIDNKTAFVNGKDEVLDVAPAIIDGRTLVPARFIAQSLGADVKWDQASLTVIITMDTNAAPAASSAPAASVTPTAAATPAPAKLTAQDAFKLIGTAGVVFIDVRTADEFATGHLQGAINIPVAPVNTLKDKIASAVPDKNTKIVVYCKAGSRATIAEQTLNGLGYTDVNNIGGVDTWAAAKLTVNLVK